MYATQHITLDPVERAAHANALLFPEQNVIVSFNSRTESEAAYFNAMQRAVMVIKLYSQGEQHGS